MLSGKGSGTSNAQPQSNTQIFQSVVVPLAATPQTQTITQIKNPNNLAAHNLVLDFNVTDTTGGGGVPTGVASAETAFINITITGATGRQLMNVNPSSGDPMRKLQHRFNKNGYYNTPPTPSDAAPATPYSVDYNVLLKNWVIYPNEWPLQVQFTTNTQSSRATVLNAMTSTVQLTAYADFVPLLTALPRTVIRVKPVTGIAAAIFDFQTYLDSSPLLDVSIDVGTDTNLNAQNSINVLVNNTPLVTNSAYQTVINNEDQDYPIPTPHIDGYFPLNVLRGMTTLYPATTKDDINLNFGTAPTASGVTGQANLYMIEAY